MAVSLQMLGTGDAFAKAYFNNNAILQDGAFSLLIDCGTTAPRAFNVLGKSFSDISAVLVTHIHGDHIGGLNELASALNTGTKMKLLLAETLAYPLWNHPLINGSSRDEKTGSLTERFDVTYLKPGVAYNLSPGIQVELIPTPHMPGKDSYSLLLNRRIFYSADMTFQPDLLLSLVRERGVNLIFHDCQLTGHGQVHTTLKELMSLPENVRRMIKLMHYSDAKPQFEGKTGGMEFLEQHKIYPLS